MARLLAAADNLKHQKALAVAYGAGLRASEVVSLKISDIDSQRMTLRIEQGKGSKDRYAMLSPVLLERLRTWWKFAHAQGKMLQGGWYRQAGIVAYVEALLCHTFAGTEGGYSNYPGATRAQETGDQGTLCPGGHRHSARGGESDRNVTALIEKSHGATCA